MNYASNISTSIFKYFQGKQKGILHIKTTQICLPHCRICRLWLLTHQSCWGELPALLQNCRTAAPLRETPLQGWIKPVQTLEGVLTLPVFFPWWNFYHLFRTKQINNRKKGEFSLGYLLLPLPSVPGQSWSCLAQTSADGQISVSFLTWPWWGGNVNFQLFLVPLVLLQPEHFTRSCHVWETCGV